MLDNFFKVNMPYGMMRNADGAWFTFNREYMPLGWNKADQKSRESAPVVYVKYPGLTDQRILSIVPDLKYVQRDPTGQIERFYLYTNSVFPFRSEDNWNTYMKALQRLADYKVK